MKSERLITLYKVACIAIILGLLMVPGVYSAEWPKDLVSISPAPGATVHIVLVGMGRAIEKHTPCKHWIVQPLGGATIWAPRLRKGEAQFVMYSAPMAMEVFLGEKQFKTFGPTPIRTVTAGHGYMMCFWTTPQTGIKSIADLKNKVIASKPAGTAFCHEMAKAQLASAGLSEKDLKAAVPIPSIAQSTSDLIEGRIDAIMYPVIGSEVLQIIEAKGECIFLNLTKDQADFVAKQMQGFEPVIIGASDPRFRNKREVRYASFYRTNLLCPADLDSEIVYGVVKALLEHHDDWKDCHPDANYWGIKEGPVTTGYRPPYHKGAIKYFKEKGLWTKEAEACDEKILRMVPEK